MKTVLIALCFLGLSSVYVQAALIELNASGTAIALGDTLEIAVRISGLGDGVAPSVGAFDLDVTFDAGILDPVSVVFGDPVLGDQLDLFGFGAILSATPFAGGVNLFELSLDLPDDLDLLQGPAFTLATLTFDSIGIGATSIVPELLALGDSRGDEIGAETASVTISVERRPVEIPEPGAAGILLIGMTLVALFQAPRRE